MRISVNSNMDSNFVNKMDSQTAKVPVETLPKQGSSNISRSLKEVQDDSHSNEFNSESKVKVEQAVNAMNDLLGMNNSTSKFTYHKGLDRYYVTVVDRETEEVLKEIPAKKLLDAFYEMQKMVGMIVDEKI